MAFTVRCTCESLLVSGLLTISLYASLLNRGVSLMVPMKTKNRPRAKESATMVTVLGEAIFLCVSPRSCASSAQCTLLSETVYSFYPMKMRKGDGLLEHWQIWRHRSFAGSQCSISVADWDRPRCNSTSEFLGSVLKLLYSLNTALR